MQQQLAEAPPRQRRKASKAKGWEGYSHGVQALHQHDHLGLVPIACTCKAPISANVVSLLRANSSPSHSTFTVLIFSQKLPCFTFCSSSYIYLILFMHFSTGRPPYFSYLFVFLSWQHSLRSLLSCNLTLLTCPLIYPLLYFTSFSESSSLRLPWQF